MYIVGKLLRKPTLGKDNWHWSEKREGEDFNLKVKYLLKRKRRTDVRFYSSCLHIIVAYFHYTVMLLMSGCTRATVTMLLRADDMSIAALSR